MKTKEGSEKGDWTGEDCTAYEHGIITTHPPKLIAKAVLDGRVRCRCVPRAMLDEVNHEIEQLRAPSDISTKQTKAEPSTEMKEKPGKEKTTDGLEE